MTSTEMLTMFYDIVETNSPIFKVTSERPVADVVFGYINEYQQNFFVNRYLSKDFVGNIETIKALKQELYNLLSNDRVNLEEGRRYIKSYTTENLDWGDSITYVDGSVKVTRTVPLASTATVIELLPITDISINRYLTNYTNKPVILQPVVFMDRAASDGHLCILIDSWTELATTNGLNVTVLNKPADVNTSNNCELDERFHESIVRGAAELFVQDKVKLAPKEKDDSNRNAT